MLHMFCKALWCANVFELDRNSVSGSIIAVFVNVLNHAAEFLLLLSVK